MKGCYLQLFRHEQERTEPCDGRPSSTFCGGKFEVIIDIPGHFDISWSFRSSPLMNVEMAVRTVACQGSRAPQPS